MTGEVVEARLSYAQFAKVLEREVTKAEDGSGCTTAARRLARVGARRAGAQLFEDGTGCLQVTGDGPAVVAAMTRVDLVARRLRHGGDGRTLDQLRADTALALLGYGQLPIDTSPGTAQPGAAQPGAAEPDAGEPRPSTGTVGAAEATGVTGRGDTRPDGTGIDPFAVEDAAAIGRVLRAVPSAQVELVVSLDTLAGAPGGVAELPGHGFITGEHAREVIGASGEDSVFHRVVTDPLDGRCVERSITAYLPDQAMLDQLRAVDRGCRAPGCTTAPGLCQPDHEMPFGQGGATAETNLDLKHGRHHWVKTARLWQSALEALSRKVTWTTLLGQVYATGPYDYRGLHPRGNHHPLLNRPERESGEGPSIGAGAGGAARDQQRMEFMIAHFESEQVQLISQAVATARPGPGGQVVVTLPATMHRDSVDVELAQVLYAVLAMIDQAGVAADAAEGQWGVPVGVGHRRGTQERHGPPPGHVKLPTLLLGQRRIGPLALSDNDHADPVIRVPPALFKAQAQIDHEPPPPF